VSLLEQDAEFARVYDSTPYQYADGWPVVWAASFLGKREVTRVTGYELLPSSLELAAERGVPTAFVGGRAGTELASERIAAAYPGLPIVHMESDQYDVSDTSGLAERLQRSGARLIVLGLGAPKQEMVGAQLVAAGSGVILCVGTALEVAAGTSRRAPVLFQRLRVEWLYRIVRDPRRLLKRYLTTFPHFVRICWRQWRRDRRSA
jgi:N-acetylglucosaminyldiphosphoundecaprenol N-acetyl-beta-D-mannosaminyltransferase